MSIEISVEVNGEVVRRFIEPRRLLSDFVRHDLGLTGTHVGCEQGVCGACTVLIDGAPARSCLTLAAQCDGHKVVTVECLTTDDTLSPLQEAFARHGALQCGFCTPGFLVTLSALIDSEHEIDDERLIEEVSANLCRCTGYQGILDAARSVIETTSSSTVEIQEVLK